MGVFGFFGKEDKCANHHWIIKWKFCLEWAVHKMWHLSAYWGIHNSTHTDLVTATAAVVQWNAAINKPTSLLHIVGASTGSHTKLVKSKTEKSESFLSQRAFSWGGLRRKKALKKIRTNCFRWCELRLMQMNVYLEVKKKDLGSILYISHCVKQHTNDWCCFSSPQQH